MSTENTKPAWRRADEALHEMPLSSLPPTDDCNRHFSFYLKWANQFRPAILNAESSRREEHLGIAAPNAEKALDIAAPNAEKAPEPAQRLTDAAAIIDDLLRLVLNDEKYAERFGVDRALNFLAAIKLEDPLFPVSISILDAVNQRVTNMRIARANRDQRICQKVA